jgi:hypothetical protein
LFKCMFTVQRGFVMVFLLWIYLISLTPSITLPYPFPPTQHCSTAFSAFPCAFFLHRCNVFHLFLLFFFFFLR